MAVKFLLALVVILKLIASTSILAADWWEDASLYQIYPKSWKDSNGNGVGDLNGIAEKLDHLKELGITATWLSPIFKSPMADNGYDISNFYEIDPIFGTMADFDALIAKAKAIGIKIILDFVPNHSSDECEWFEKSINREEGYEHFYVWDDGRTDPTNPGKRLPPSNWVSVFGGSAWTWNEKRQQFFLHQFLEKQPDLNFRNPDVRKAMLDILKFWLDRGVDGFRIDAIPHVFEKINSDGSYPDEPMSGQSANKRDYNYLDHIYTKDQYETIQIVYEWRSFLDSYQANHGGDTRVLLAEAYSPIEVIDQYFGNGTHFGAHLPFNFNLMSLNGNSNARDFQVAADSWMNIMWKKHKMANWVLGNHDNPRISDRFGSQKIDLINVFLAGMPGVTVTYYGEEIGMSNVPLTCSLMTCDVRDSQRTPFQWNNETSAGFSISTRTWLPIASNYKEINVRTEKDISRSTLNIFKQLQDLKRTPTFKSFRKFDSWNYGAISDYVFQIIRFTAEEVYRILINLGDRMETVGPLSNSIDENDYIMEYCVVTKYSPHNIGDRVDIRRLILMPYEAVVLKSISNETHYF